MSPGLRSSRWGHETPIFLKYGELATMPSTTKNQLRNGDLVAAPVGAGNLPLRILAQAISN